MDGEILVCWHNSGNEMVLKVCISISAAFRRCRCDGTSWNVSFSSSIYSFKTLEHLLSNTCAATSAPMERRRESNTNLQEPFHCRNCVNTQGFSHPFMVPSIASSYRHIKPSPYVNNKPHPLSTLSTPWPLRFQCNAVFTAGNKSNCTSKSNNQKKLGTTR